MNAFTCEKCGWYNEWTTDDEDDIDEDDSDEDDYEYDSITEETNYYSPETEQRLRTEERLRELTLAQKERRRAKKDEHRVIKAQKKEENRVKKAQKKEQWKRFLRRILRKKQTVGLSSDQCKNMQYGDVITFLKSREFYNFRVSASETLSGKNASQEGVVARISIDNQDLFEELTEFPYDAFINIAFYSMKKAFPPLTSRNAKRADLKDIILSFRNAGFENLYQQAIPDITKRWLAKDNYVEAVMINGRTDYKKNERFRIDTKVVIIYHTFKDK